MPTTTKEAEVKSPLCKIEEVNGVLKGSKTTDKEIGQYVDALFKSKKLNTTTEEVVFKLPESAYPEGLTPKLVEQAIELVNNVGIATEVVTAAVTREEHGKNDKVNTYTGTTKLPGVVISSTHHLKQTLGEEVAYGQSVTGYDYPHHKENKRVYEEITRINSDIAKSLFS